MRNSFKLTISYRKLFLVMIIIIAVSVIISLFLKNREDKIRYEQKKKNEKLNIEYLKNFSQRGIKKLVIVTRGNIPEYNTTCLFEITDRNIIKEFKVIIERQGTDVKKAAWGQTGRVTHITMIDNTNEKYSFIARSEPYSGQRLINEIEISFFYDPSFDVSDNIIPDPGKAISKNIDTYGPVASDLQNYELYYFLKKHIIDYSRERGKNTDGIYWKCF